MPLLSASGASPLNAPMLLQKVCSSSAASSFGAQLNSECHSGQELVQGDIKVTCVK